MNLFLRSGEAVLIRQSHITTRDILWYIEKREVVKLGTARFDELVEAHKTSLSPAEADEKRMNFIDLSSKKRDNALIRT